MVEWIRYRLSLGLVFMLMMLNVAWAETRVTVELNQFDTSFRAWTASYRSALRAQFPFLSLKDAEIYGVKDAEALQRVVEERRLSQPPKWAFGVCWPSRGVIVVRLDAPLETIQRTLMHELVHLEFGESFQRASTPVWFSEGLAQLLERGMQWRNIQLNLYEHRWGKAQAFDELVQSFPHHGSVASRAYAQSEAMVDFMRQEFGADQFKNFVRALHIEMKPFEAQFERTYGVSLEVFETKFLDRVHTSRWWHELFKDTTIFSLMGILLALGAFRSRRKQRERLAELRLEEVDEVH